MKKLIFVLLFIFILGCIGERKLSPQECEDVGGRTVNIVSGTTCEENEENYGKVIGFISPNICCIKVKADEFCGWSTNHECSVNNECVTGGCSAHVCGAVGEEMITTCEWTECYNAKEYGVECKCVENKCQWS